MNIPAISEIILDETSSTGELREALDAFTRICTRVTKIRPDPSFDAWAGDALLDSGVAINPEAAAHCALDYMRSVVFIRGVNAAIKSLRLRFPGTTLEIVYAGCGPFATLIMPLLGNFTPGEFNLYLLDIHQRSLDAVELLLSHFGFSAHTTNTINGDACSYRHTGEVHLVIAETMQKSLEQEPQFAVTANLAPQLWPGGVFIPQRIDVALYLTGRFRRKETSGISQQNHGDYSQDCAGAPLVAPVCTVAPERAFDQMREALAHSRKTGFHLEPVIVMIPRLVDIDQYDAALLTRICVFEQYKLGDCESQITLPLKCPELSPLVGGQRYEVCYQLGSYPKFNFDRLSDD